MSAGKAAASATVAAARAHVQPCTVRTPTSEQPDAPRDDREEERAEDGVAAAVVVAARAEEVLAVHGDPDRPEGEERQRERRRSEREHLTRAAPAASLPSRRAAP